MEYLCKMSDNDSEEEFDLPLPPRKKQYRKTNFSKCVICQVDTKDVLRTAKEASMVTFKRALDAREDDVCYRLSLENHELSQRQILWHHSCYSSYTSIHNIKHTSKQSSLNSDKSSKDAGQTSQVSRVSRSTGPSHDWSKCLFCKNRSYKKSKVMINVSTTEACDTIMDCAKAKGDDDMVHILLGVRNDLIACEAKYHKTCHASYTSNSNLKWQCLPKDEKMESAYEKSFRDLAQEIEIGINSWKAFDMSSLLNKYIVLLEKRGVDAKSYKKQNLKIRMKNHFGERIVFQQPYRRDMPEIVYSSEISLMDVINFAAAQKGDHQILPQQEKKESTESLIYKAAKMLKASIKECKGISVCPLNLNDIELSKAKSLIPPDLYLFLRWLITNDELDGTFDTSCNNVSDERRIICLAQDIVHCLSHGHAKLPKHVALAMAVRHITGSKEIVTILNRMGNCSSYDEIERVDTCIANTLLARSSIDDVIPSNIVPGNFVQFACDNNDLNEETLDGRNTTHATTLVAYQRKLYGPMQKPPEALVDNRKRKRSMENAPHQNILECSAHGRRPSVTTYVGQMGNNPFTTTSPEYQSSYNMDLAWALSRIPAAELFETIATGQAREEAVPVFPNWSAFNSLVFTETTLPSVIGYFPMINAASTELSTIYTVLKKAQRVCAQLDQIDVVVTFDLALYAKAKQIQFKFPEEFKDTVIRMGGFHIALNFIAVIGKRYENSGLEDILIESGAYGPNTVTAVMKGKSYNRGVRAHKLLMEALFRLRWQAFVEWLKNRSVIDTQFVIRNMESLQLIIKNKENVAQNTEKVVSNLKPLMDKFEAFREDQQSKSNLFKFWDEYIHMVMILLQFIKAERSANWHLHITSTTAMVPYFFAHDRPNYSRWLPIYLKDMALLEKSHPEVYRQFQDGDHAISRSTQPFARVWTDMALEQSINLDSKSKGGIIGISQNPEALQRWFITSHERAAITTAVKKMSGLNDSERVGTHKEAGHKRALRDEKDVNAMISCFTSGPMKNPFLVENESLSNIATGVVLPRDVAEKLTKSAKEGLLQMKDFVKKRMDTNAVSFWDPISSLKIKTFKVTAQKATVKASKEQIAADDRDLFGRLLIVAKVREINLREILSYELSAVPYSLAHSDGSLRKTTKSVLLQILEGDICAEPRLNPTMLCTTIIIDVMALVQMLKFAGASTFGELARKYFEVITSYYNHWNCNRIDLVFDQYWDQSIKAGERQRRGEVKSLEVEIHNSSTPVPKQWHKYITNVKNKVRLCAFLTSTLIKIGKEELQRDKELVLGGGSGDEAFSVKHNHCEVVEDLIADHEEADTRMVLHSKHAALESQRIIVQSPDTDVLLLCVSHFTGIGCSELWFRTGTRDRLRYIPAHTIARQLGPSICKALPALHSLTGCDSTSSFSGIGKTKAWKAVVKKTVHQETLGNMGQSLDVDEEMTRKVESFVCSLYTQEMRSVRNPTVDDARYLLFCQRSQNNMALPPTCDSLQQHIKRANYQAYVWRNALTARQNLPSPNGHGWKSEDDMLSPILMTRPAAPENILELTSCRCLKSSCTRSCSCSINGLACTESCKCMGEESCQNPNKATNRLTDDQLSDDSTDFESDDED